MDEREKRHIALPEKSTGLYTFRSKIFELFTGVDAVSESHIVRFEGVILSPDKG